MKKTILLIVILGFVCSSTYGDDSSEISLDTKDDSSSVDKWEFIVTPYLWLPSVDAKATADGTTQSLDLDFSDIIDTFDVFGLSSLFEARKGKWSLVFDFMYVDLDARFRNPVPILDKVGVHIEQTDFLFGVGYRLLELPLRQDTRFPALTFDLVGAGRYAYLKQKLTPKISGGPSMKLGKSKDWVEPVIGGRFAFHLTDKVTCIVRGNIGGFGVGSASKKTWKFMTGFGYRFSKKYTLKLGYQIYDIDYNNGSGSDEFGLDGKFDGPWLGLSYHF